MNDLSINVLVATCFVRQKEWDPNGVLSLSYRGNEMGGECGEAQNMIKKIERENLGLPGSRATKAQLAEELADTVICAAVIAAMTGIDLAATIRDKFNKTSMDRGFETRL